MTGLSEDDVVRVFKDGTSYKFEGAGTALHMRLLLGPNRGFFYDRTMICISCLAELFADREQRNLPEEDSAEVIINQQQNAHNHTLKAWVITERFPLFVKVRTSCSRVGRLEKLGSSPYFTSLIDVHGNMFCRSQLSLRKENA